MLLHICLDTLSYSILSRTFKWDTWHHYSLRGCKTAWSQSWKYDLIKHPLQIITKFENWWSCPNFLEKYSRIIAISFYFTLFKWIPNLQGNFLKNPPEGAGHGLKCIQSKSRYQSKTAIYHDKQLCFYIPWRLFHSKGL